MEDSAVWKRIDSSAYLFLRRLFEPRDNALTIILEEAVANESKRGPVEIAGTVFSECAPIERSPACSVFQLYWRSYVSYCVTEEMHGSCGEYEDEDYTGRLLRVYAKSHFLDFVAKDTGAHSQPYRHYKIACQNHNIDVISVVPPELTVIDHAEAGDMQSDSASSRRLN